MEKGREIWEDRAIQGLTASIAEIEPEIVPYSGKSLGDHIT